MPAREPINILWIQTDEQRTDSLGCFGNGRIRTPILDALAKRGTLYLNHHVVSPVCVPSRVCELTSRYPHQTGILNNSVHYNWGTWPRGMVAFPELFAEAGYVTASFGKYHTPHHTTWLENWHFVFFADEATHFSLAPAFDETEHEVIHLGHRQDGVILSGRYPSVHHSRTPQTHLVDNVLDWLRLFAHVRRPFLLRVSFLAPHTPVLAPEPFYSMYDPNDMDWDMPTEDALASRPRYEVSPSMLERFKAHCAKDFRQMRCSYYGLVSHIDQQVGRLIEEMTQLNLMKNTVIVYTSDHGDLMGEYGQFQKGVFYDITTRVPFLISGPGIPAGKSIADLTESIDLGPTLLRLAGLPVPDDMEGYDLLDRDTCRDNVIGEICLFLSGHLIRRSWIRTMRWSLDFSSEIDGYPPSTPQERDGKLIDLIDDPQEHRNLYYDPAYAEVVECLQDEFARRTSRGRRPIQIGGHPRATRARKGH
jgi:choline-sulfatase